MSNVIEMNQFKPQKQQIDAPIQWVTNLFEVKIKNFRERKKRKIDALLNATYDFYLDLYLTGVEQNKLVDIHPALYKKGYTICTLAYHQALQALIPILEQDRINECYKNLQKMLREREKEKQKSKINSKIIFPRRKVFACN